MTVEIKRKMKINHRDGVTNRKQILVDTTYIRINQIKIYKLTQKYHLTANLKSHA